MRNKKIDLLVTILLLAVGATLSYFLNFPNPIVEFFYLGIPSLFLMIRERKNYRKIGWGVFIFGILMGGFFDFLAKINNAWIFTKPLFPNVLIGDWLVENLFAYIFMTLFVIVFYEHFLDDERDRRLSKSHSKILLFLLFVTVIVFTIFLNFSTETPSLLLLLKSRFCGYRFPACICFL